MNRRLTVLTGALTLVLTVPQAATTMASATTATTTAPQQSGVSAERDPDAEDALGRLRADANGTVRVHRTADGAVDFVSSNNGQAMVEARGTNGPTRTAADQLSRYGEAFGIDDSLSRAVVKKTIDSSTGGSVVRADQVVDGVPVFGGQVVMSLDENDGVVSVDAATTGATEVPAAAVSEAKAQLTALRSIAKTHRVAAGKLTATANGRRLYDPEIVHAIDPAGTRPAWEFEVTNGLDIRETVLVGTERGEIALHFNDAPGINRVVCDNAGGQTVSSSQVVPQCTVPTRAEDGPASSVTDVNAAYDNLGATADTYLALGGRDLTEIIGTGTTKKLMSTVRWCFSDMTCPFPNAFWDGTQMVFGTGYAGADDVVAHELTHGYVERTSALFMLHQSAALNESLADIVGEVVDHRYNPNASEDNTAWNLGEDIPGGAIRNLKDPTIFDQPDKMTSPNYVTADLGYDNGAVHENDGVGNKTAYLISQGGTFNGRTVAGIDGGDATLAKTGRLFLEVIPRLTSGSEYADLGRVLASTCDELVAAATAGFAAANCTSVRNAVLATELALAPTDPDASAPEAAVTCPARYFHLETLYRHDDDEWFPDFSLGGLWQFTPDNDTPTWAHSGDSSWFAWDPDPDFGDPNESVGTAGPFQVPAGEGAVLSFHHAYAFEFAPAGGGLPAKYYDGGQVIVQSENGDGSWTTQNALPWVNGPTDTIIGSTTKGFGGDSHGYGSSTINLTSLAGKTVRVQFKVLGDDHGSVLGWFVDDIRLNTCVSRVPTYPQMTTTSAGMSSATVTWKPPAYVGSGVASYQITSSSGKWLKTVPGTARSATITGLNPSRSIGIHVTAFNAYGEHGHSDGRRVGASTTATTTSVKRARKNKSFTVMGRVVSSGGAPVIASMPLLLQKRLANSSVWRNVAYGATSGSGTKAWTVRQRKSTYYRVVSRGMKIQAGALFGSTSAARLVKKR